MRVDLEDTDAGGAEFLEGSSALPCDLLRPRAGVARRLGHQDDLRLVGLEGEEIDAARNAGHALAEQFGAVPAQAEPAGDVG